MITYLNKQLNDKPASFLNGVNKFSSGIKPPTGPSNNISSSFKPSFSSIDQLQSQTKGLNMPSNIANGTQKVKS